MAAKKTNVPWLETAVTAALLYAVATQADAQTSRSKSAGGAKTAVTAFRAAVAPVPDANAPSTGGAFDIAIPTR